MKLKPMSDRVAGWRQGTRLASVSWRVWNLILRRARSRVSARIDHRVLEPLYRQLEEGRP